MQKAQLFFLFHIWSGVEVRKTNLTLYILKRKGLSTYYDIYSKKVKFHPSKVVHAVSCVLHVFGQKTQLDQNIVNVEFVKIKLTLPTITNYFFFIPKM